LSPKSPPVELMKKSGLAINFIISGARRIYPPAKSAGKKAEFRLK
jgi:hypothetical protein